MHATQGYYSKSQTVMIILSQNDIYEYTRGNGDFDAHNFSVSTRFKNDSPTRVTINNITSAIYDVSGYLMELTIPSYGAVIAFNDRIPTPNSYQYYTLNQSLPKNFDCTLRRVSGGKFEDLSNDDDVEIITNATFSFQVIYEYFKA